MADCNDLWITFADFYGAKALESKFGAIPPDSWKLEVGRMNDWALQRGVRRLKASGRPHIPTLPEFLRLCREVGSEYDQPTSQPQTDSTKDLPELPRWETTARRHLLACLIGRDMERNMATSDPDLMQILVDAKTAWAAHMREWEKNSELPPDHGRALWNHLIQTAEETIDTEIRNGTHAGRAAQAKAAQIEADIPF